MQLDNTMKPGSFSQAKCGKFGGICRGSQMNKQQAAEFLGVSVRALERYVQQGRISVKYEKGRTRPTANFNQSELEAFKAELNQPTIKPAVEPRQIATEQYESSDKLVHEVGEITELSREILRDAIVNKKLPAAVIGRSWRIKRSDLECFIANLF
ncbi:hypothetical protein NIES4106_39240 [Fischerella sp. NIES-4106]|nr:hypothetical protein NIES4106_39240 [Fischerella sp. NIES-4106]